MRDGSPFRCDKCTDRDREARNCANRLGLSDDARAVDEWTDDVKAELAAAGASKVFTLGALRLYECPLTYMETETWEVIRLVYLIEDSKHLLFDGGLGSQPRWLIEAMEIYKIETARRMKENDNGQTRN